MGNNRLDLIEKAVAFSVIDRRHTTGYNYFNSLAKFLGDLLQVDRVHITNYSIKNPLIAETIAVYTKNGFDENVVYTIKGTPCENVLRDKVSSYVTNVQALFPEDKMLAELDLDSYVGTPLWNSDSEPIGLIAVLDGEKIKDVKSIELVLQILGAKASQALEKHVYERKLKISEERIKRLLESSEDMITIHDTNGQYLYYNGPVCYPISAEDIVGKSPSDLFDKDASKTLLEAFKKVEQTGRSETIEVLLDWLGEKRWFSEYIYPIKNERGETIELVKVCRDIHKQKIAEKGLEAQNIAYQESEKALQASVEEYEALNEELHELVKELVASKEKTHEILDNLENANSALKLANIQADKNEQHFRELFEFAPIAIWEEDFSDVKKYIDEISPKINDFESYLNSHREVVLECLSKVKILNVNNAAVELYEATSKNQLLNTLEAHFSEESYKGVLSQLNAIYENKTVFQTDSEIVTERKIKKKVQLKFSVAPGFESNYEKVYLSLIDITDRENLQKSMSKANANLNQAQKLSNVGNWQWNMNTDEGIWSDEMYRIYGVKKDEFYPSNENVTKTVVPEDLPKLGAAVGKLLENQIFEPFEFRIRRPSGEIRHLYIMALEMGAKGSELEHTIFGVTQDVTERKISEKSLHQFAHIASNSTDMIFLCNTDFVYLAANDLYIKMLNLTEKEIIGSKLSDVVGMDYFDSIVKPRAAACFKGELINYQTWLDFPNVERKYMDITYSPFIESGGEIIEGVIINLRDITNHKIAEDKIQSSLEEKKLLLRELYHRTKNNMQVISSMLSIQAMYAEDQLVKDQFEETKNRILTMALVHEKLYQAQNLSSIALNTYVTDLIELLKSSFGIEKIKNIEIITDLSPIKVSIDTAVPCGLIINELFTNAVKHAFPNQENGELKIHLKAEGENYIHLKIADNGVGFPDAVDYRNSKSYGLQAVMSLVEHQLGGTFDLVKDTGTTFNITLKRSEQKARV